MMFMKHLLVSLISCLLLYGHTTCALSMSWVPDNMSHMSEHAAPMMHDGSAMEKSSHSSCCEDHCCCKFTDSHLLGLAMDNTTTTTGTPFVPVPESSVKPATMALDLVPPPPKS